MSSCSRCFGSSVDFIRWTTPIAHDDTREAVVLECPCGRRIRSYTRLRRPTAPGAPALRPADQVAILLVYREERLPVEGQRQGKRDWCISFPMARRLEALGLVTLEQGPGTVTVYDSQRRPFERAHDHQVPVTRTTAYITDAGRAVAGALGATPRHPCAVAECRDWATGTEVLCRYHGPNGSGAAIGAAALEQQAG